MAGEKEEQARQRLGELKAKTLDEVAVVAATNLGSTLSDVANVEVTRRVAEAQISAANAQRWAALWQCVTAVATLALVVATIYLAWNTTKPS